MLIIGFVGLIYVYSGVTYNPGPNLKLIITNHKNSNSKIQTPNLKYKFLIPKY